MICLDLDGKIAVVTGASRGLGRAIASALAEAGCDVALLARKAAGLEEIRAEAMAHGRRALCLEVDVADEAAVERAAERVVEKFGRVDVLVNNAGVATITPAESEQLEVFRDTIEVNVSAAFHLSQLAGRCMLERGRGSIVQVASILGIVASAPVNQASYCASKSALIGLTRELGCQWARRGVRVNALAPGGFASQMNALSSADEDDPLLAFVRTNCPMGRYGEPHELDGAILFLAADASSYMTGQTLVIDGGWVAR
jgi:NAD(P)-dependent dehydrogenase (short-subunit alcohol dehydrogenase family)